MKKVIKAITAAFAAIIASTAMISSAGAATYIDRNGNTYYDGCNDGMVYYVDDLYGYGYYQDTYVGFDDLYGYVYYDPCCGYYSYDGYSVQYLGWNYTFTQYVGVDCYGRPMYYNSAIGYFIMDGAYSYISCDNNLSKVAW